MRAIIDDRRFNCERNCVGHACGVVPVVHCPILPRCDDPGCCAVLLSAAHASRYKCRRSVESGNRVLAVTDSWFGNDGLWSRCLGQPETPATHAPGSRTVAIANGYPPVLAAIAQSRQIFCLFIAMSMFFPGPYQADKHNNHGGYQ